MKGNSTMKRFALFLCLLVVLSLSCDVSVNLAPSDEVPTAAETPVPVEPPTTTPEVFISLTQAIPGTPVQNSLFTFGRVTLEIPSSVASGASGRNIHASTAQDGAEWENPRALAGLVE
jgi:hypothetical protein